MNQRRYRSVRSHLWPRSRTGVIVVVLFVGLLLLAEWPVLAVANRIEPLIGGIPFLFAYLFLVYVAMIVVLIVAALRDL